VFGKLVSILIDFIRLGAVKIC